MTDKAYNPLTDTMLTKMCQWFEDAADATRVAREQAERDRDYYDNIQLTTTEIATLKKRGQPPVIINRIKPKIDFLLGMERQMRTDPKAAPRTPQDEQTANAATDSIRYVCDDQNFSQTRSYVFENEIIEGMGGAIVEIEPNLDVLIKRIPWDRIYYDPHSTERDFSDAKYKGIVVWMDLDDAKALYPDKSDMLDTYNSNPGFFETYADKPRFLWYDSKRKRVRICEAYYNQGGWKHCVYTKAGFLVEPHESQYVDEDEVPTCPIELVSANVDRENNRYGVVRQLIGPQDEINKRRSKALHLLTMRQTKGERGAVDDVMKMKREMAKPDGHIEITPGMLFEVMNNNDQAQGQLELLQEAKNEIDAIGANAALSGKDEKQISGRALQSRQQGGLTELGPVFDALRMWQRAIYKQIWNRIKQYWTSEKWVRITDDEQNIKFVGLNQPVTMGEQMIEKAKSDGAPPEQLQQMVQQISQDPQAQQPTGQVKNDVRQMDVDIILEDVPDVVNLQSEQFELLSQMYQANPQVVPFKAVIQASSLRNKSAIIEELNKGAEQQAQEQQVIKQQGMEKAQADTQKTQSETAKNVSEIQKNETETTLKRMEQVLMAMHAHMQINAPPELGTPPTSGEQNAAEYRAM